MRYLFAHRWGRPTQCTHFAGASAGHVWVRELSAACEKNTRRSSRHMTTESCGHTSFTLTQASGGTGRDFFQTVSETICLPMPALTLEDCALASHPTPHDSGRAGHRTHVQICLHVTHAHTRAHAHRQRSPPTATMRHKHRRCGRTSSPVATPQREREVHTLTDTSDIPSSLVKQQPQGGRRSRPERPCAGSSSGCTSARPPPVTLRHA